MSDNKENKKQEIPPKKPNLKSNETIAPPPVITEEIKINPELGEPDSSPEQDLDMLKEELPKNDLLINSDLDLDKEIIEPIIPVTPIEPEIHDALIKEINSGTSVSEAMKKDYDVEGIEVVEEESLMLDADLFKVPVDPSERKYYEVVLKSNRQTIGSLRKQLQEALAKIESLTAVDGETKSE